MQEWDVVGVIVALTGLFAAVVAPIVKLTRAITRLNATMESLEKSVDSLTADNSGAHERLWQHAHEQDRTISDHEARLRVMEDER